MEIVFVANISTVDGPAVGVTGCVIVLVHGHISVERIGITNAIATIEIIVCSDAAFPNARAETIHGFVKAYGGITIVAGINRFYTNCIVPILGYWV
jgi:hypothetical protein